MHRSPDDQIDPYEPRLTRRVGEFAEQAVRPFDASAVAAAARAGASQRTIASRLFGSTASMARASVVLAGALVAVVGVGLFINAGGSKLPGPSASTSAAEPTPTSVPNSADACAAGDLAGV